MSFRISLFTSGRFHMCDLARELSRLGHDVTLYSLVPTWIGKRFGVPARSVKCLTAYVWPTLLRLALARSPQRKRQLMDRLKLQLDQTLTRLVRPCDVFIGMSGMCNAVAQQAKRAFSAQVRIQRCSRHILSQREILKQIPHAEQVSDFDVQRELSDYQLADRVDVPAEHCLESFLERGFPRNRLFCNHFGVDLDCFISQPTPALPPTFIMVGTWSLRKGCDLLLEAWREMPGTHLMHVGPVGDLALPEDTNFTHHRPVPQEQLPRYYGQSHIMCLASREEGLAFVQPQALACGLQLVCTSRSGGADLQRYVADPSSILVVPPDNVQALRSAMEQAVARIPVADSQREVLSPGSRHRLSWANYALRYCQSIEADRQTAHAG